MANCHRNNVGNLVLGHDHSTKTDTFTSNFRLWNAASFRRLIFDAISCGASSRYHNRRRYNHDDDDTDDFSSEARSYTSTSDEKRLQQKQEEEKKTSKLNAKSEKLSDLLNLAESESFAEAKKKEEALEELKRLVKDLQQEDDSLKRRHAATTVRMLAKENLEVRGTLAMLGVIPPLVAMLDSQDLDSQDLDSQIASLYALLNLGIGNDALVFFSPFFLVLFIIFTLNFCLK